MRVLEWCEDACVACKWRACGASAWAFLLSYFPSFNFKNAVIPCIVCATGVHVVVGGWMGGW